MHVDKLPVSINTDAAGNINWDPRFLDHDASLFYRGKQLTSEEFNKLFLEQAVHGNYITDTLKDFFDNQLGTAIGNKFRTTFDLHNNFVQIFVGTDWTLDSDGYYKITIPADGEGGHGFVPSEDTPLLERINIMVTMYIYADEKFYTVKHYTIDDDNNVTLYSDVAGTQGLVIIQDNNKAFSLTEGTMEISQVTGLQTILDAYGTRITAAENNITNIINGDTQVGDADHADLADEADYAAEAGNTLKFANKSFNDIFESGTNTAKQATRAKRLSEVSGSSETYVDAGANNTPVYFNGGVPKAITNPLPVNLGGTGVSNASSAAQIKAQEAVHATNADNATNATNATNAINAINATNATNATNANHANSADTASLASAVTAEIVTKTVNYNAGSSTDRYAYINYTIIGSICMVWGRFTGAPENNIYTVPLSTLTNVALFKNTSSMSVTLTQEHASSVLTDNVRILNYDTSSFTFSNNAPKCNIHFFVVGLKNY